MKTREAVINSIVWALAIALLLWCWGCPPQLVGIGGAVAWLVSLAQQGEPIL